VAASHHHRDRRYALGACCSRVERSPPDCRTRTAGRGGGDHRGTGAIWACEAAPRTDRRRPPRDAGRGGRCGTTPGGPPPAAGDLDTIVSWRSARSRNAATRRWSSCRRTCAAIWRDCRSGPGRTRWSTAPRSSRDVIGRGFSGPRRSWPSWPGSPGSTRPDWPASGTGRAPRRTRRRRWRRS
jgi:hypothetical protein